MIIPIQAGQGAVSVGQLGQIMMAGQPQAQQIQNAMPQIQCFMTPSGEIAQIPVKKSLAFPSKNFSQFP